jgi:hypothetical protein
MTNMYRYCKQYCTIGWVDIGTRTKVPLRFVTFLSKVMKINKKSVLSQCFIVGQNILGHALYALYRGPTIFFSQYGLHGYQKTQDFT